MLVSDNTTMALANKSCNYVSFTRLEGVCCGARGRCGVVRFERNRSKSPKPLPEFNERISGSSGLNPLLSAMNKDFLREGDSGGGGGSWSNHDLGTPSKSNLGGRKDVDTSDAFLIPSGEVAYQAGPLPNFPDSNQLDLTSKSKEVSERKPFEAVSPKGEHERRSREQESLRQLDEWNRKVVKEADGTPKQTEGPLRRCRQYGGTLCSVVSLPCLQCELHV